MLKYFLSRMMGGSKLAQCFSEKTPYALSASQMNIWNAEKAFWGTSINIICATIRINGALDIDALQRSIDALVRAEDGLRTRITLCAASPVQYTVPYEYAVFPVYDFTRTDTGGLAHWEETLTREPMPVVDAPLYDFRIFKQNESEGGILVRTHHIISDGWSQMLLCNRIASSYLRLVSNGEADAECSPSYRLHIDKEQEYLSSRAHEKDLAFWRERLVGFEGASAVKDCLSATVSPVGRRKTFTLSHVLNHLIRAYCEKERVAPFAVYYMALAIYLCRTLGTSSTAIGVPVFNRADMNDKNTIGMFVSTLPFIGEINENWTFDEFNRSLAEQWYDLLRHQRLPFYEISSAARELHPLAGSLFHTVLSYQTSRIYKSGDASVTFSGRWHYSGYQSEHLLIHLASMEDDYRFSVDYDYLTQIYTERDIDRLHEYLTNILTAALSAPETPLWKLPMIGLAEKERVLFAFNQTGAPLAFADAPSMLACSFSTHQKRAAVICGGSRVTYEALFAKASSFARAYDGFAGSDGCTVAVCLDKGPLLAGAVIAAAISGRTWLTLPSDTPPGRLNEILEDSAARVLVCGKAHIPPGCPACVLDPADAVLRDASPYAIKPPAGIAYTVYTSGSTGRPKGVLITQKNLVNLALATRELYGHGAVISLCSEGFDVFVLECAVSLMNGRTIVFPTCDEKDRPEALASLMRDYAVGNMALPPSRLEAYMKSPAFAAALSGVETIICGGEHFPSELMQALRLCTDAAVYNQYGPSETAVAVCYKRMNGARSITIGAPMQNCRMYVLDAHLQPLPTGVTGDLYIGGACVGAGYRNLGALNEKSFLPSPFEQGERIYRTGDVGAWTDDGEISIGGRRDDQIKLRGLRIEPQEIAARVAAYEKVDQAAVRVIVRGGGAFIAAYYTADGDIPEAELTAYLRSYLPAYMLPGAYMRMASLPVTRSGKIDVAALPEPRQASGGAVCGANAKKIADIFAKVLKRADIAADTDYFLAGGDSLSAMECITEIERATGARLSVADVYIYRTPGRIAAALCPDGGDEPLPRAKAGIPHVRDVEEFPATETQTGIYFDAMRDPSSTAYNMPGLLKIPESIDIAALAEAIRALPARHRLLRAGFSVASAGLVGRVSENARLETETVEGKDRLDAMRAFVRPFDVSRPPLMRAALWRSPDGETFLLTDMHHLIGDGLSSPLMLRCLDLSLKGAGRDGQIDFIDYALMCAKRAKDEKATAYWREALRSAPALIPLPFDERDPETGVYAGGKLRFTVADERAQAVRSFLERADATPFMLFITAFALVLRALSGADDMLIGTPVSGRGDAELWAVPGPFIRALPVRIKINGAECAMAAVSNVKSTILAVMDASDAPMAEIMRAARGEAGGRLFNALFSMRPVEDEDFTLMGETLSPEAYDTGAVKFPLALEAARDGDRFGFTLEYAQGLIGAGSASLIARCFCACVDAIASHPDAAADALDLMDPADRFALFDAPDRLCAPFADVPLDCSVISALRAAPDAPAIVFHSETVTCAGVMRESLRIARALSSEGVGRGDSVAVMLPRTPALIEALVGILCAGAAYVPMLASFPRERIDHMLETSGAKLVLTDRQGLDALAGLSAPAYDISALPDGANAALPPISSRDGADTAYILFTSGTTGRPKGARVPHRALANLLSAMRPVLGTESRNVICSTNAVFDIFVTESLLSLAMGKTVILADEEEMLLPQELARLISVHQADAMQLTPSRLRLCLENPAFAKAAGRLSRMLAAGEALPAKLAQRFYECSPGALFNLYGPTETSVYATMCEVPRGAKRVAIGRPLINCRAYVLRRDGGRALPLANGELFISGVCVGGGYVHNDELTEKSFFDDPFFPGQKMYKSGDGARLLPTGELEYAGRLDSQIKLNGQRIEPLEISSAALESGLAAEAATVPVYGTNGELRLRLAVAPKPGARVDESALRAHLAKLLPAFMMPAEILVLDRLPKNASGKTDMRSIAALCPANDVAAHADASAAVGPEADPGDKASALEGIWRQALGRDEIDRESTFFEQGGGSLAVLDVLSRCYAAGIKLSVSEFYAHPTLSGQIALIASGQSRPGPVPAAEAVRPDAHEAPRADEGDAHRHDILPPPGDNARGGVVLFTGATGFLGAHVVNELMQRGEREIVCIVRGGSKERLTGVMSGYFGEDWPRRFGARLRVLDGDTAKPFMGLEADTVASLRGSVRTLIHCAADVRHYVSDEEASIRANAGGAANAVRLALRLGCSLSYISTMSVAGEGRRSPFTEQDPPAVSAGERNVYVRGKCAAEEIVRRCAASLPGVRIFRIGRLVGRSSDGVFQKNRDGNAFYSFLQGALMLSCYPESARLMPVELTPVDLCAKALALLLDERESVYHVFNTRMTPFAELMRDVLSHEAVFVADDEFEAYLARELRERPCAQLIMVKEMWDMYGPFGAGDALESAARTAGLLALRGFEWQKADTQTVLRAFFGN